MKEEMKNILNMSILLYGAPKIGKSTWAVNFVQNDGIFIATEPGLKYLDCKKLEAHSWIEMKKILQAFLSKDFVYKMVVIDTIDNAYKFCSDYVCNKNKIEHESDLPLGKGWQLVRNEFDKFIFELNKLKVGTIFISHTTDKRMVKKNGVEYNITVPDLPPKVNNFLLGMMDMIFYCDIENKKDKESIRIIHAEGSQEYYAGDRSGKLPKKFLLDGKYLRNFIEKLYLEEK